MDKLEKSLVDMANQHYLEAKSWAETQDYNEHIINMANDIDITKNS